MGKNFIRFFTPTPIILGLGSLLLFAVTFNAMINPPQDFITTWETTTPNESITIPTTGGGYNYSVDWGDGNITSGLTSDATHVYTNPGVYTVSISGDFPRIYFNDSGDKLKIKSIEAWGNIQWQSMRSAFSGTESLIYNATDAPNLLNVMDLSFMFHKAKKINGNFTNWDVSNITEMQGTFFGASEFNGDISNWDVSNVTTMNGMFTFAFNFNNDISNWDVENVQDFTGMFNVATSFNQNLGSWDFTNAGYMSSFLDHTGMSVSNYDLTLAGWLAQGLYNIPSLGAGNLKYCNGEEQRNSLINDYYWNIYGDVLDCTGVDIPFKTTWLITTANESITIPTSSNDSYDFIVNWGDGDITYGNTGDASHVYDAPGVYEISISGEFPRIFFNEAGDKDKIISIEQWGNNEWTSFYAAFAGCSNLIDNSSDVPDLSNVTDMRYCFYYATNFDSSNIPNWDVSNVEKMGSMFAFAKHFKGPIGIWDVSNVTDMSDMFRGADIFNSLLTVWDVSSVVDMSGMFWGALLFNQYLGFWDVSNVTNMKSMFQNAPLFNQDISNWDVSKVTNMSSMFNLAISFNQNIGSWDVSNVLDMSMMFLRANVFNQDISNWDVSRVKDMLGMFYQAYEFNQNIGTWSVDSVTNMSLMFYNTKKFNQDIGNWNVEHVTDMSSMFSASLRFNQDISGWNVGNVENYFRMFLNSYSFNHDIGGWSIRDSANMEEMLDGCGMCYKNYDATLEGWQSQAISEIKLGALNLYYCESDSIRSLLIDNNNWQIIGDYKDCSNNNIRLNLGSNQWFGGENEWTKNRYPRPCETVIIPDSILLQFTSSDTVYIDSIFISSNSNLILQDSSILYINKMNG